MSTLRVPALFKPLLFLACIGLPHGLLVNSQILPDAPIEGVRVTMFSDEGYKLWNLQGSSATYLDDGAVELKDMDLEVYEESDSKEMDMHILGNQAIYQASDRSIAGGGGVHVDGQFYQIEGENWKYTQDDRVVRVTDNVKVVIRYELEAFLK